jgi:large subunit ribosomal protein L10
MALKLEDKKAIVAEVNEAATQALSAVMADYRGLTVSQMTDLRKQARENAVYLRVVRNTLARRAVEGTEYECITEVLTGPTILAFSQEDPGAAARIIKDFIKENKDLEVKGLAVSGQFLPADQLDALAKLPTRDQALAMLMATMIAPVTKLAQTLNEIPASVTRVVAAVKDQKEQAA